MHCAGVGIVESFFTMTVPKPILVIALIMATVAVVFAVVIFQTIPAVTPDRQAVAGKPEAPANQGVSAKSVQEFRQAHPDAFVVECVAASPTESGETRRLQCPLDIENGNVWLDMWAKDRHNNTVVKREILARR